MQVAHYKQLFIQEARGKCKLLEDLFLQMEKGGANTSLVEKVLTTLHSLKGAAATMSYMNLANAVHEVEDLFIAVREKKVALDPVLTDNFYLLIDAWRNDIAQIAASDTEADLERAIAFTRRELANATPAPAPTPVGTPASVQYQPLASYVEVTPVMLERALERVNDLIANNQHLQRAVQRKDFSSVYLGLHNSFSRLSNVRQLIIEMKMMPVRQYFAFLSRLVRDVSRQGRKFITLEFNDNNLRLEQQVLESLNDVCVQLIKNAVDHGYHEGERGTVVISFTVIANAIQVTVTDQGHGIDWQQLRERARIRGFRVPAGVLTDAAKRSLLFLSKVSSKPAATMVSGRGLGLTIIAEQVASLYGSVDFLSQARGSSKGTTFTVTLPLRPSMFRAITWRWGHYQLALPIFCMEKLVQLPAGTAAPQTITYKKKPVPVFDMFKHLGIGSHTRSGFIAGSAAVIAGEGKRVAVLLPLVVHEEELIVKHLASLASKEVFVGAAVSEYSVPVIIINHNALFV